MSKKNKYIIVISILTFVVFLRFTYAYFSASQYNNQIDLKTINGITFDYVENTDYMIQGIIPSSLSNAEQGAKNINNNNNGICKDANNEVVCNLYEFTVTNTSDVSQDLQIYIYQQINTFSNLKYLVYNTSIADANFDIEHRLIDETSLKFNNNSYPGTVIPNLYPVINSTSESKGIKYTIMFYVENLDIDQSLTDGNKSIVADVHVFSKTASAYSKYLGKSIFDSNCKTNCSSTPNLTVSSVTSKESGLFKSYDTNDGSPTYYFRGSVTNNYVSFADKLWRIIRINEDGTIRMVLSGFINNKDYPFGNIYYSDSKAKTYVDTWYNDINNFTDRDKNKIVLTDFCEQAKVKYSSEYTMNNVEMNEPTSYIPNFKCSLDGNEKGPLKYYIGLLTYDENVFAGAYPKLYNTTYYLNEGISYWTMSPSGNNSSNIPQVWTLYGAKFDSRAVGLNFRLRPVISLKSDVLVQGTGIKDDPYVVQ